MLKELYFIATPIGNLEDITLRGLRLLKESEIVIVEEYKVGKKLLDQLGVDINKKEIIVLNEHNELSQAREVVKEILFKAQKVSLISDGGHPVIADSGHILLKCCLEYGIAIKYVPGASSILGTLLISGFENNNFYYGGFLPRKPKERDGILSQLRKINKTIIIMETPYRLESLLKSLKKFFSKNLKLCLAFNLTKYDETVFRGTIEEALNHYLEKKNKKNFVLVLNNTHKQKTFRKEEMIKGKRTLTKKHKRKG